MRKTLTACAITALLVGGGTATAAKLITGKDIKDGSIESQDIGKGEVSLSRLGKGVQAQLRQAGQPGKNGTNGKDGAQGAQGDKGDKGDKGEAGAQGPKGDTGNVGAPGADAAAAVNALVPFAADESTTQNNEWRSYQDAAIDAQGIKFGPFANGTDWSAAYTYALKGLRLKDITLLAYSTRYTGGSTGAAPYVVVVTEGGDHVMFAPAANVAMGGAAPVAGTWQRWVVTQSGVTYNDDGANPTATWQDVVGTHGGEKIDYVQVQAGNAGAGSDGSTSHVSTITMEASGATQTFSDYTFGS